jgi:Tol biopolymer transport system component
LSTWLKTLLVAAVLVMGAGCEDGTGPGPGRGNPTGNRIAFLADGNAASMRENGSNQVRLTERPSGDDYWEVTPPLHWSPDGTRLLAQISSFQPAGYVDEAVVIPADGSGYRRIAYVLGWGMGVGNWSPDGTRITYYKATSSHLGSTAIFTASAEGGDEVRVVTNEKAILDQLMYHDLGPAWSPDGSEIAFVSDRPVEGAGYFERHIFAAKVDGSGWRQLLPEGGNGFAWAPDGTRLAVVLGDGVLTETGFFSNIYLVDRDGSGTTLLSQQENVDAGTVWSPDGSRIAFTSIRDGNLELYIMNADGGGVQRLTNHPAEDKAPAWSPDGTRLAFQTNRDGNWEIYSAALDGSGLTNLTRSPSQETTPAWK